MSRRLYLFATTGLAAVPALAQTDPSHVQAPSEIVVTAPTPLSNVGEGALAFPAQTASDEELERSHATDLTDYLKRVAGGVFVNEVQGNPLQPDINYRGFTASPLLGTPQGLSVYQDGVRVNQPFGDVVSWDLIPKSAIRSVSLVPGSNPLFGRNSLGGALSIRTKDGTSDPGYEIEGSYGSFRRKMLEGQAGGSASNGIDWFASGDWFKEKGWRDVSQSEAKQLFGKVGWSDAATAVHLSGSYADTDLNGNGLQEMRLLAADRASVYSYPDTTKNRAWLANLTGSHRFSDRLSVNGNIFWRHIRTRGFNGDVNDDALGENLYQPSAAERTALARAGYTGFPTSGETQANTPFPKWRCIANILLNSEPNEKCDGLANRSGTTQREWGATGEVTLVTPIGGVKNALTVGLNYVAGRAHFTQLSQFGYLTSDRTIVTVAGPGAFADGSQDSENAFDARVDMTGRTTVFSAYALDAIELTDRLHVDLSTRYDRTAIRNRDRITPGGGSGSLDSDQTYDRLNPAIAVRYAITKALAFDAAVAQTSRVPSAIELGCADPENPCRLPNALAGDPPLKQVVARTVEGGVDADLAGIRARVGAFRTVSRNDILFLTDDASGFGYFRNFGKTRRQGIDVDLSGRVGAFRLTGHYSFLDATYRSAEQVDGSANSSADHAGPGFGGDIAIARGDRIPLIPRHTIKAGVGWDVSRRFSLDLELIAVSSMIARGNENGQHRPDGVYYLGSGKTDPYAVVNVGAELRPVKALTLFVQVNNILDKHYATAAQLAATAFDGGGNFVARPFATPVIGGERPLVNSTFYAPGAPRSVQAGIRFRF
ncbi:TonB-dependent receptor [Sphingomonas sp. AP4-R1]|uniref:TonB-dependent receptor n=1 Tax=Sphingomonas sp. AP4-R1 TaxID=2735134 RepID=UPI001493A082|nr:TonB-dependent receptor [Sphingomonas sp. AP4-R1]QJU60095.1 TonB-dependent receptor [Sphingomonas sp. AP4-R1]